MIRHSMSQMFRFGRLTVLTMSCVVTLLVVTSARCKAGDGQANMPFLLPLLLSDNCPAMAITGSYLLSFHACDTDTYDCTDPSNHSTYVAESDDGSNWSIVPGYTPHQGSVPDLIRRDNILYVYNIGTVRTYDFNTCEWSKVIPITVEESDGTPVNYADPSLIEDSFGRLVMFYLATVPGSDPARCAAEETSCTKTFRSATEKENGNGTSFIVDAGDRAMITITSSEAASDPDIFSSPEGYVLYISRGMSVQALSSATLLGYYVVIGALTDGMLSDGSGGIPSGYYNTTDSRYWTYVHTSASGTDVIRRAVHETLASELLEADFVNIVSGSDFDNLGPAFSTASPGFAVNTEGP